MKLHTHLIRQCSLMILTLLLIASCKQGDQTSSPELTALKKKIEQQQNIIKKLTAQLGDTTYRKPTNIIRSDFAKEIYHLYDAREELINGIVENDGNGEDFKATRSLFYDFQSLQDYIKYVKKQSKKAQVKPSGFRFYFALYSDNYARKKDKAYAKRQTFFIAPTVRKKIDGQVMDLGYTLDNDFKVVLLKEKLGFDSRLDKNGNYQKASFFNFNPSLYLENNSMIANEINSSPPKGKNESM